jgi:hypothetical protein
MFLREILVQLGDDTWLSMTAEMPTRMDCQTSAKPSL